MNHGTTPYAQSFSIASATRCTSIPANEASEITVTFAPRGAKCRWLGSWNKATIAVARELAVKSRNGAVGEHEVVR